MLKLLLAQTLVTVKKSPVLTGLLVYALSFLALCFYDPALLARLGSAKLFYDEAHYLRIAQAAYSEGSSPAFHPLLPLLTAFLSKLNGFADWQNARLLSLALTLLGAPLFYRLLLTTTITRTTAAWVTFLYLINPFAIFHVLAYTESLFSLLSLLLLTQACAYLEQKSRLHLGWCGLYAALLALTRPSFYPFLAVATVFAILYFFLYSGSYRHPRAQTQRLLILLSTLVTSSLAATALFFWYLKEQRGSFFAAITAQKDWGRQLGLHWQLLTNPRCLNGSKEVLTWELHAFYGPMIIAGLMIFWQVRQAQKLQPRNLPVKLSDIFLFWFAVLYTGFHTAVQFLTYDRFYSIGRHVLSLPFFFIALAFIIDGFQDSKQRTALLKFYSFASFVYLCMFWHRLALGSWMG